MKKITLITTALLLSNMLFAQHLVQYGFKAGASSSKLQNKLITNPEARLGFHVGALAHIHMNKSFAIQPELVYSTQGSKYADGRKDKLNYVNLPVLAQYMFANGFRLETGPQLGYLVGATSETGNTESDLKHNFKKGDFSWSFGTGYVTRYGVGIDARYNLGVNNINKNNTGELRNRVWQVGLFYQLSH